MYKYEICTDNFEFHSARSFPSMTSSEILDVYFSFDPRITSTCVAPKTVASFDSEDEAVAFFHEHYDNYGRTSLHRGNAGWLLMGNIAWLELNEYDEDGDLVQDWGILCWSTEPYWEGDDV